MTKNALSVAIEDTLNSGPSVKKANPRRGAAYRDAAIDFSKEWPIGATLTWDEFCLWAVKHELLDAKHLRLEGGDKQSDEWLALLQRRHQVRSNLNKAASHPELIPYGGAFVIAASRGALIVRSTTSEIAEGAVPRRIASLASTNRKQLEYLIQSTDWSLLPPHERGLAETVHEDINNWVEQLDLQAKQLERKFSNLKRRLNELVRLGQVKPTNGGIAGLFVSDDEPQT